MGLLFLPLMAVMACSGLNEAEQAEYDELKVEIARITIEELAPRQERLREIINNSDVDVDELQAEIARIRAEKLAPLEAQLAALHAESEPLFAAPSEPVDEEALNKRFDELEAILEEQREKADALRAQIENLRNGDVQADIEVRLQQIAEVERQLEDLRRRTDERALAIQNEIAELDGIKAALDPESDDYAVIAQLLEDLSREWEEIHEDEANGEREFLALIGRLESEIKQLERSVEDISDSLWSQLAAVLEEIERDIHRMEQEQADILALLQPLVFGAAGDEPGDVPEEPVDTSELEAELEAAIQDIIDTELRPLMDKVNAIVAGEDFTALIEELKVELEDWLARLAELRERFNELTRKSFESLLSGVDLSSIFGDLVPQAE